MPDHVKFVLNAGLALATLFLTALLWRYSVALIALLLVTAAAIFRIRPNATSIVVYLTAFVFGPAAEAVSITTGAWTYDSSTLFGIPVWLPFVWGNAGLFILNMAELWKSIFAAVSSRRPTADRVPPDAKGLSVVQSADGDGASVRSATG
jgi:uncharacterized membrane protein YoaT (DUF817 family)